MFRYRLLVLCVLVTACGRLASPDAPRISAAEAERAFAADAQTRTVQEAFLTAFARDAVTFRPGPVNAHEALSARPYPATTLLRWTPTSAETAAAGDLAVTSGPAEWGTRGQPPTGTGYFLSVWRAAGGKWSVVFDAGIEAPIPATVEAMSRMLSVRTLQPAASRSDDGEQMRNDLLQAEQQLIADYPANLRERAATDIRVFRRGHAPSATTAQAITLVAGEEEITWIPQAAFVARSGDLGYVYGTARTDKEVGYVRVWRKQESEWKVAYDLK